MIAMFPCDKCGLCCQSVSKSPIYKELDRGDGTCRYYDDEKRLCSIYDKRPLLCNVDAYYDTYLKDQMSREAYYQMNLAVCEQLKNAKK